jgi:UDP-glucose 4-epimerase
VTIVVTGANGFVGRPLVAALRAGHEVVAVDRAPDDGGFGLVVDLAASGFTGRLPGRIDAVVHLAQGIGRSPADVDPLLDVNVASTVRLVRYAASAGARAFVFASTGSVYARSVAPLDERAAVAAHDFYSASKLAAEYLLVPFEAELAVARLRLFVPYGPGQAGRMVPRIVEAVREGGEVTVTNGGQPRTKPIYIDDLVAVIADVLVRPFSGVLNVAGPEVVSVRDIAARAGECLGRSPVLVERQADERWDLIADTRRLAERMPGFGWTAPRDGIRAMVERDLQRA